VCTTYQSSFSSSGIASYSPDWAPPYEKFRLGSAAPGAVIRK
jgi:hypothetical protein